MAAKRKSDSDWVSWVVIAVLFLVGLSPIALVVLLVKLFGRDGKKRTQAPPLQTDTVGWTVRPAMRTWPRSMTTRRCGKRRPNCGLN